MNKLIMLIVLIILAFSVTVYAEDVISLLARAIQAPGNLQTTDLYSQAQKDHRPESECRNIQRTYETEGYPIILGRLVALGKPIVPELEAIRDDQKSSWQQKALAGICIERINRGAELKSFKDIKRWREDAELKKDPTWRDRGGPYGISSVAAKRWLEAGLTNHLVQLAWKGEGEHPPMGHSWDLLAAKTLEKINYPYLVNIAREHVRAIKDPKDIAYGHVNWYFDYLLRVKDHDSLALVFDLWLKYRPIERAADYKLLLERKNTVEQSERGADAHVERWLALILPMATPADEGWITEKLKDIKLGGDGQRFLSEYQQRCRQ